MTAFILFNSDIEFICKEVDIVCSVYVGRNLKTTKEIDVQRAVSAVGYVRNGLNYSTRQTQCLTLFFYKLTLCVLYLLF